jgi:hypothetical protein
LKSIKRLFTDPKFIVLNISFGSILGAFNIYGSLLDNILDPFGYTND